MAIKKRVIVIGAGPCGLVALKEMLQAGHDVVALEKGPGTGGAFCRSHDQQYDNLYLTISNIFMAYSDFPPEDSRIKYSSKTEYGEYLDQYVEHFGLREHIMLNTEVKRASLVDGRWVVTTVDEGGEPRVREADALIVATGSNHAPKIVELDGFTGSVIHSSQYVNCAEYTGKKVLLVGVGESASDIGSDISHVADETTIWARSPITVAPRFPGLMARDTDHDEVELMKDESKWSKTRVSDFLEVITTSRMANAMSTWEYSVVRHALWTSSRFASPATRNLGMWNRFAAKDDPWQTDQVSVPTKNGRICTEVARGNLRVVLSNSAVFSGRDVTFPEAILEPMNKSSKPSELRARDIDTVILCTGYRADLSWIEVEGLDSNPRTWFKHCFPAGLGDKLMFLGWARPHQGGIPACADILSRYIAAILSGERSLPADYAEQALEEGATEIAYYKQAGHVATLVDYPAFIDSIATLIGCMPNPPPVTQPAKLIKYWMYPNWSFWYRQNGPGATPEILDRVLDSVPLERSFRPDRFIAMTLLFSLMQLPVNRLVPRRRGLERGWMLKSKRLVLHGNS